ncbi:unnamed protein product [Sphenostylis stenocarpa]|uniref:Uncharacterized protein n=1 Tax=Sphenostylis stenocarpa TaxID=92480 RepID=A0AA86VX88_9FABA|nr:unnamed protein product [Sphenostylis stenocarpa]
MDKVCEYRKIKVRGELLVSRRVKRECFSILLNIAVSTCTAIREKATGRTPKLTNSHYFSRMKTAE